MGIPWVSEGPANVCVGPLLPEEDDSFEELRPGSRRWPVVFYGTFNVRHFEDNVYEADDEAPGIDEEADFSEGSENLSSPLGSFSTVLSERSGSSSFPSRVWPFLE